MKMNNNLEIEWKMQQNAHENENANEMNIKKCSSERVKEK
jgi:hypothetical protein